MRKRKNEVFEELEGEIENDVTNNITSLTAYLILGILMGAAFFTLGNVLDFAGQGFELSLKLLGVSSATIALKNAIKRGIRAKYNNMELKHLDNIPEIGIKKNERLDEKRNKKIKELNTLKAEKEKKQIVPRIIEFLTASGSVIGSCATLLFPHAAWLAVASLALFAGIGAKRLFSEKEIREYETRINNLCNDLELGEFYGYNPESSAKATSKQQVPVRTDDKEYTREHTASYTEERTKEKPKVLKKTIKR